MFTPRDFDIANSERMVESERGAGHWFWKPLVILEALKSIHENEILVYCDSLYTWIADANVLVHSLLNQDQIIAMSSRKPMESSYTERDWICPDIAQRIFSQYGKTDVDKYLDSYQAWSGLIVVRKCVESIDFLQKWCELCSDSSYLISSGFPNHRHDQALISLLAKTRGENKVVIVESLLLLDETLANYRVPCKTGVSNQVIKFDSRDEMVRALIAPGSCIVEVGVFLGDFASTLMKIAHPNKIWLVDPFKGTLCSGDADGVNIRVVDGQAAYELVCNRFSKETNVEIIREASPIALAKHFEDESIDVIYLDGDHTYEGCRADLDMAWRKLRRGGWLMGHDYYRNPDRNPYEYTFGVRRAIDEFCRMNCVRVSHIGCDGYVSFAIRR
jgi:hypothetical protein